MSKGLAIAIVIVIAMLAGGVYLGKKKYDSMLNATSEGIRLGKKYGKFVSQSNCTIGLQLKYAACSTTECELSARGYIAGCMETADKDDFCGGVPRIKEVSQATSWASQTCAKYNLGTDRCPKYMHTYVSVCTAQVEARAISNKEIFESSFERGLKKISRVGYNRSLQYFRRTFDEAQDLARLTFRASVADHMTVAEIDELAAHGLLGGGAPGQD